MDADPAKEQRRSLIYIASALAQGAGAFLVLPLATRVIEREAYGAATLALSGARVLATIVGLGLPAAVLRAYVGDEASSGALAAQRQLVKSVAWLLAAGLTTLLVAGLLGLDYRIAVTGALTLGIASGQAVAAGNLAYARAAARPFRFAFGTLTLSVGSTLMAIALAGWGRPQAVLYLSGFLAGTIVATVGTMPNGVLSRKTRLPSWVWRFSLPTVLHQLGVRALSVGDRIIIGAILGAGAVARYHVAYVLGAVVSTLVVALNNDWTPRAIEYLESEDLDRYRSTARGLVWVSAGLTIAVVSGGPIGHALLAPSEYVFPGLRVALLLVALSGVANAVYQVNLIPILHGKQTRNLTFLSPVAAAVNVGSNLLLIGWLGLVGAAVATLVAYMALGLGVHLASRLSEQRALPISHVVAPVTASAVGGALFTVLPDRPTVQGLGLTVGVSIVLVAWRGMTQP